MGIPVNVTLPCRGCVQVSEPYTPYPLLAVPEIIWDYGADLIFRLLSVETGLPTQKDDRIRLAAIDRGLIAKAETIESLRRAVPDGDSTEILAYGASRSKAPTTATSSQLAFTFCGCSIVRAPVPRCQ
jgi:hypothetical protein